MARRQGIEPCLLELEPSLFPERRRIKSNVLFRLNYKKFVILILFFACTELFPILSAVFIIERYATHFYQLCFCSVRRIGSHHVVHKSSRIFLVSSTCLTSARKATAVFGVSDGLRTHGHCLRLLGVNTFDQPVWFFGPFHPHRQVALYRLSYGDIT